MTQLNRRLTQLAATDGLTGLTNRRTFDGFLQRAIRMLRRDFGAAARYRQFQGLQRHLRTSGGRSLPAGRRKSDRRRDLQYVGPVRALWRRGIRGRAAGHRRGRRLEGRRGDPADGSGAGHSQHGQQPRIHHDQRGRRRHRSTLDEAAWWEKPTPRSTKPSVSAEPLVYSSLDLQYVESASIQHDGEFAPANGRLARARGSTARSADHLADR